MSIAMDSTNDEAGTVSQPRQAFDLLMQAIATGKLERGVILKEARLAREFGVGRGALREAVSRLEGLHILQREPNLGIRVIDFFSSDISEIFVVREAVEGMACRVAALTMTNEELDRLALAVEEGRRMARAGAFLTSADDDFHFQIARATRNRRLIHLVCDDVYFQLRMARHGTVTHPARLAAAAEEHGLILEALGARDPARAEEAMRRHIVNGRNYVEAIQRSKAST
jgi:DNA-binding GntR family transcriptional regulator